MRRLIPPILVIALFFAAHASFAAFRFPMPEFESGYKQPTMNVPLPAQIPPAVDFGILVVTLSLAAWFVLKRRSRREVFLLAVFSLGYFGFYRNGCVCAVGAIQNVFAALIDRTGAPWIVIGFFFVPILFALYFGRVFCAAVCPLGAIQEMTAIRPVEVPKPMDATLSLLPYAYLGFAVVALWTGSGYLICRYDPFVGFFRQGATFNMLLLGGLLLVIGVFVARPYCRYLCPYGVLLRWASMFAKWHASITPKECIQCRLCEASCPYGAILTPTPTEGAPARKEGVLRLGRLLVVTPLLVLLGAWCGHVAHRSIARVNPIVSLSERVAAEDQGRIKERSVESDTFRAGEQSVAELHAQADAVRSRFAQACAWFGAFMGLVISAKLIRYSIIRERKDYVPDRGACLSCARCFAYCPVDSPYDNERTE